MASANPITEFLSSLWTNFKTEEKAAVLPILANTAKNVANNPTALNFLAQATAGLAQIEAAQPSILQAELQQISTLLQSIAAEVATPPSASTKGTGSPAGAGVSV